jgi:hypothetical protein
MSEKTPRVWEVRGYDAQAGRSAVLSDPSEPGVDIVVDSPAWFEWLEAATTTSFSYPLFDPASGYIKGFMTGRKEPRKRGTSYWSVYRRCQGRVQRVYLGRSVTITVARLNAVATSLHLPAEHRPSMSEPESGSDGKESC